MMQFYLEMSVFLLIFVVTNYKDYERTPHFEPQGRGQYYSILSLYEGSASLWITCVGQSSESSYRQGNL